MAIVYTLRAHHGMCLAFFEQAGYSSDFVRHMGQFKETLLQNPQILLTDGADEICRFCPNNLSGSCKTQEQVHRYDSLVLERCGLKPNTLLSWEAFAQLVEANILKAGRRAGICGDCEWNALCSVSDEAVLL